MKTKYALLILSLGVSAVAAAQETDDMYFNAKDRLSQIESNQAVMASRYAERDAQAIATRPVNPSDTYTGRGVNPEYNAQKKNGAIIGEDTVDYFLSNYAPKDVNKNLYNANNTYTGCGCGYRSPYSSYSAFNPYGMYSPYGSMYSPYGSMYSPYGYSPYSSMMGYGYGGGYGYGSMLSLSMGYGMGLGSPYGYGYGYGNPYGYAGNPYSYGYNPDVATVVYGRRPVRSTSVANATAGSATMARTNGRTRDVGQARTQYYDQGWRKNPSNFPSRTYDPFSGRQVSGSSSGRNWNNSGNTSGRSWNNGSGSAGRTRTYSSGGSPTRSMGSFGGSSGGSRSGGGGGTSRGRN